MLRRLVHSFLLLMVIGIIAFLAPWPEAPAVNHPPVIKTETASGGRLEVIRGVKILYLYGKPYEMGRIHGELLREPIRQLVKSYVEPFLGGSHKMIQYGVVSMKDMVPHIPKAYMEELRGLADGAGLPLATVLVMNTFVDLKSTVQCSTICVRPPLSDCPLFGRNLDFLSLGIAEKHSVVIVRCPQGSGGTVSVSWPGMLGVVSGYNKSGLSLAMLECYTRQSSSRGMPYALLYRKVLESSTTIDQVIDLVGRASRTSSNNLMIQEPSGKAAVIEVRCDAYAVRRIDESNSLFATNHHRAPDLKQNVSCRRYGKLENFFALRTTSFNLQNMFELVDLVDLDSINLQAMVFCPKSRDLHLSVGKIPAAQGPFVLLTAAELLGRCTESPVALE